MDENMLSQEIEETEISSTPEEQPGASTEEVLPEEEEAKAEAEKKPVSTESQAVPIARFNEVYAKSKQAEREAEYWKNKALERNEKEPPKKEPASNVPQQKPTEDQFETYGEYVEALSAWKVDAAMHTYEARQHQMRQAHEERNRETAFLSKLQMGQEKYQDFQDTVHNPALPITLPMLEAVRDVEIAHEVLYYLGKHPQEAFRLADLSPYAIAREIGKLEMKLTRELNAPKTRIDTKAPNAFQPVQGSAPVSRKLEDMSQDEYNTYMNKREYGR